MNRSKKIYDKEKGIYVYIDRQTGSGIFDAIGRVLKPMGKQALESGSKKLGDEVGKMAAEKIVSKVSKVSKPRGKMIMKELGVNKVDVNKPKVDVNKPKVDANKPQEDINLRINRLLSGGKNIKII